MTTRTGSGAAGGRGALRIGALLCASVLALALFLPPALYFSFDTASHGAGTLYASILIFALSMLQVPRRRVSVRFANWTAIFGAVLLGIVAHFLIASLIQPVDLGRAAFSLLGLVALLAAAIAVSLSIFDAPERDLDQAVNLFRAVLLGLGVLAAFDIQPDSGGRWPLSVYPFTENSHYALALTPFLIDAAVRSRNWTRYLWLAAGLLFGYVLQNLTLVVGACLAAALSLSLVRLAGAGLVVLAVGGFLNLAYFTERVNLTLESNNLSALVYRQGWDLVLDSIARTKGWGVGFQQLGNVPINSYASQTVYRIVGSDANLRDGGFVAAKLISEFGAIGAAITITCTILAVWGGYQLRRSAMAKSAIPRQQILALAFVCAYMVDLFARGLGYFSGGTILLIGAIIHLSTRRSIVVRRSTPRVAAAA